MARVKMLDTNTRATALVPDGITYHGAHFVLAAVNASFVGAHVIAPKLAFVQVLRRKFPVLIGILQPLQKSLLLLFFRHMQEELQNDRAVPRQMALEGVDVVVAFLPDLFRHQRFRQLLLSQILRMNLHYQNLLIVGPVENGDLAACRTHAHNPPKIGVIQFLGRRRLKAVHVAPLRIQARCHVLHHSVLARRVHGLQHHQYRPQFVRIHSRLLHRRRLQVFVQYPLRRYFQFGVGELLRLAITPPARVDVFQAEFLARQNVELFQNLPIQHNETQAITQWKRYASSASRPRHRRPGRGTRTGAPTPGHSATPGVRKGFTILQNPILRERLRRDACLAMARTQPRDAAALLPRVIHSRWLPAVDLAPVRPDRSLLLVGMLMDREALELVPAADRPFAFVEIGADLLPGFASIRFRSLGRHN